MHCSSHAIAGKATAD